MIIILQCLFKPSLLASLNYHRESVRIRNNAIGSFYILDIGRNAFQVVDPLRRCRTTSASCAGDDQLAHDWRLGAAVRAVIANHDPVVLLTFDIVSSFGYVEGRVINGECKRGCVREVVSEGDVCRAASLDDEWSLGFWRCAHREYRESVVSSHRRGDE